MIRLQEQINQLSLKNISDQRNSEENTETQEQDEASLIQQNQNILTTSKIKQSSNNLLKSNKKNKYNKLPLQKSQLIKKSNQSINFNLSCIILGIFSIILILISFYWIIYQIREVKTLNESQIKTINKFIKESKQKQRINNNNNVITENKQIKINKQINKYIQQKRQSHIIENIQQKIIKDQAIKTQNSAKVLQNSNQQNKLYIKQQLPQKIKNEINDPQDVTKKVQTQIKNPPVLNKPSHTKPNKIIANITYQHATKWRGYEQMLKLPFQSNDTRIKQEYQYYEAKYNISKYTQIPICVVVPSYNNVPNQRYKDNLKSILQQNYSNYHIVFIDDVSQDKTGQMVLQYLKQNNVSQSRAKVIINKQRKYAMQNLRYAAMNQCKQEQLFIIVDGDDMLIGRQVFKLFSAVMQQKDLWVMYTNFLTAYGGIGYSRQYTVQMSSNYRRAGFVISHLRAYYTKLFRFVLEQDLKNQKGQYYTAANDVAICLPILQMAHPHIAYVPQITYYYNLNTGLNNHQVRSKLQRTNQQEIKRKKAYANLKSLFGQRQRIYASDQIVKKDTLMVQQSLLSNLPNLNDNNTNNQGKQKI